MVVMGPSGAGKSAVGGALAALLGLPFVDADALHPERNRAKMAAGTPLEDADRWPWLDVVGERLARGRVVIACSALKRRYRDHLRGFAPGTVFVELRVDRAVLADRMARREHFMPVSLLDSQLAALEPLGGDEAGVVVGDDGPLDVVAGRCARLLLSDGERRDRPESTPPS
ncbi:gluconokinase [Lentzea sp. NBRC 102530]|nr:gluconokinase [Lentzea sp. NBRC 102530]